MSDALIYAAVLFSNGAEQVASPPCKNGAVTCEPWERAWPQAPNPFDQFDPKPEKLGRGPHTLVISDGNAIIRIEYATGAKCKFARDAVRAQVAPPPNSPNVVYAPSSVTAFCVPR